MRSLAAGAGGGQPAALHRAYARRTASNSIALCGARSKRMTAGAVPAHGPCERRRRDRTVPRSLRGLSQPPPARRAGAPAGTKTCRRVPLVTLTELWEKAAVSGLEVEEYNLDRRQFVLDLLETAAARFP